MRGKILATNTPQTNFRSKIKFVNISMSQFALSPLAFALTLASIACNEHQPKESFPFLVKIEVKGKIFDCAGTILTPCIVLTSAHCVEGVEPAEVTVSHITPKRVTKYKVASTAIHPKYKSAALVNEIALLQTEKDFQQPWSAVALSSSAAKNVFQKCSSIQILGWSDDIMKGPITNEQYSSFREKPMKAPIKLLPNENCSVLIKNFRGIFEGAEKLCGVTNEEEGAGCFTGPGGPLLCSLSAKVPGEKTSTSNAADINQIDFIDRKGTLEEPIDLLQCLRKPQKFKREAGNDNYLQVGVISWGKSCSRVPSVYIRIDSYYDWISRTSMHMSKKCSSGMGNLSFLTLLKSGGGPAAPEVTIFLIPIIVLFQFL